MANVEQLPVAVLSCNVLRELMMRNLPDDWARDAVFMDYGLHRVPDRLRTELQGALERIPEPSLVIVGYGLCGNGLNGLQAGRHQLLVPRVDDCIAMLLGSYRAYLRHFEEAPGTYYLSKGWLESGSHPLSEYQEYVPRYGPEQAMWIMDQQYQHYERLVLVAHDRADLEAYRPLAQEVARFCERWGMRYEEVLGSERYVRRLVEGAAAPELLDGDFVLVPPGGDLRQVQFMR